MLALGLQAFAGFSSTFNINVKKNPTGIGKVYVSDAENATGENLHENYWSVMKQDNSADFWFSYSDVPANYLFVGWSMDQAATHSSDIVSTDDHAKLTLNGAIETETTFNIYANFSRVKVQSENEAQGVAAILDNKLVAVNGDAVRLKATSKDGYEFDGWKHGEDENYVSTQNPYSFTVGDETAGIYTACFKESTVATALNVIIDDCVHGTVEASPTSATSGTPITLTVVPDAGYEVGYVRYDDKEATKVDDTHYTFNMPNDNVIVSATFRIPTPTGLAATGITQNSATITWTAGKAKQWQVTYSTSDSFNDATTTTVNVSSHTYNLTNLQPATYYYAKVRAYSGEDYGTWSEVLKFKTIVEAITTYPWTENFDSYGGATSNATNNLPLSWHYINTSTDNSNSGYPIVYSSGSNSTHNCLYFSSSASLTDIFTYSTSPQYAILPPMANLAGKQIILWAKGESTNTSSSFKVGMMTNPTDASTFKEITNIGNPSVTTSYQPFFYTIPDDAQGNYVAIMIEAVNNLFSSNSIYIDDITITPYLAPTNLTCTDITASTATISWEKKGTATQWQICIDDDEEHLITTNSTPYTIENLASGTLYTAKVRAIYGQSVWSSWSSKISFNTDCEAITSSQLPWSENFDNYTGSTSSSTPSDYPDDMMPGCWRFLNRSESSSNYPQVFISSNSGYAVSGNCLFFKSSSSTPLYAVLPPFEDDISGLQLNFTYRNGWTDPSNGTLVVGYMTDPMDATTFTAVHTCDKTETRTPVEEIPFTSAPAGSYIAFRYEGGSSNNYYLSIDDVSVAVAPTCPRPKNLKASNVKNFEATLGWTERGEATQWQICLNGDEEHLILAESNPFTLTGLTAETTYTAKVRAYCSETAQSMWDKPVTFTTDVACPAPTDFTVADLSGSTATLNWTGTSESYMVSYRTAAYTDGLEERFTGSSIPPGWETKIGLLSNVMQGTALSTGSQQWFFGTSNGVFDQHAKINIYGSERHGWLISPAFTVVENASLTFDLALTAYSGTLGAPATTGTDDKFVVLITTDDETTWTILRQWDNEEGSTYVYNDIANTAEGEQVSIDLSSYVGQSVRIAFYGESTESNADNNLHIDNVGCGIYHEAGQWQTVTVDEAPATLTGLTPETAYQAKLQGNCGDVDGLSEETGLITFTTLNSCPVPTNLTAANVTATTADLSWHGYIDVDGYTVRCRVPEHIEGGINETFGAESIPSGWTMYTGLLSSVMEDPTALTPTTFAWSFGNNNGVFDSHACVNIYYNNQRWLVTPTFTLASSTFTFDLALTAYSGTLGAPNTTGTDDKFVVLISTDNMETWTILRQWDNEEGSTYVYNNIANTAEGEQVSINLSSYVGRNVRIAFYGESTVSNADNNLHIDNVIIGNPTVVPDSEWLTAESTATDVTLTDLTPMTTYEAQVKSTCSDPEEWSNVVTFTTLGFLELADNDSEKPDGKNNAGLISGNDGTAKDVMIAGRTLFKNDNWNTICLPFGMTAEQVAEQLNPTKLMELDVDNKWSMVDGQWSINNSGTNQTELADDGTLYLFFTDADAISAGVPYIIKWASGDNIVNPVFSDIVISNVSPDTKAVDFEGGKFVGTYSYTQYTETDQSILFLGSNNMLYYPEPDLTSSPAKYPSIGAFRAYFDLGGNAVRAFVLNFGEDEATGISLTPNPSPKGEGSRMKNEE